MRAMRTEVPPVRLVPLGPVSVDGAAAAAAAAAADPAADPAAAVGETPGVSSVRLIAAVPDAVGAGVGSAAVGIGTGASPSIARFAQLADLPVDAGGIVAGGPSRMACATLFLYFSGLSRNLT